MAQNVIFLPAWVSWPPPGVPAVLENAKTLLRYPLGGFMKLVPLPGAPTGGQGVPKGRHDAAAAIVRHRHGQEHRPHHRPGARENTIGAEKYTTHEF